MLPRVSSPLRRPALAACLLWLALMAAVLAAPALTGSPDPGDDLTRNTVRLSLLYYSAALTLMLSLGREDWAAQTARGRLARSCWAFAWAAFLVHLGMAFHYVDHWSHAATIARMQARTGFGEGVYVSHLFTLAWSADVAFWWLAPRRYAARPRGVDVALHTFMLFIVFNATIVFEDGLIRWAGAALFAWLLACATVRLRRRPGPDESGCANGIR